MRTKAVLAAVLNALVTLAMLTNEAAEGQEKMLYPARVGPKVGFIDKNGSVVIQGVFDDAGLFSEGLAPAMIGGKWGIIDATGRTVIDFQFPGFLPPPIFREG